MTCNISNLAHHACIASIDLTNFYKRHSIQNHCDFYPDITVIDYLQYDLHLLHDLRLLHTAHMYIVITTAPSPYSLYIHCNNNTFTIQLIYIVITTHSPYSSYIHCNNNSTFSVQLIYTLYSVCF